MDSHAQNTSPEWSSSVALGLWFFFGQHPALKYDACNAFCESSPLPRRYPIATRRCIPSDSSRGCLLNREWPNRRHDRLAGQTSHHGCFWGYGENAIFVEKAFAHVRQMTTVLFMDELLGKVEALNSMRWLTYEIAVILDFGFRYRS